MSHDILALKALVDTFSTSSVRYDDEYIRHDGRWYISTRIARFTVIDKRTLQ